MAYTAVKGGQEAILAAERLVVGTAADGRLGAAAIRSGAGALIDQVMGEGGLYAPELAAVAIAQAEADPIEAAFLLRAYRSTLPRIGYALPVGGEEQRVRRRISSAFKDLPGGQLLGRTRDYTQRLLDPAGGIAARVLGGRGGGEAVAAIGHRPPFPKVVASLRAEGLVPPLPAPERRDEEPADITRDAPVFPAPRSARLQALARGETGFMVALAYSVMRGFGAGHPTIAELRGGDLPVRILHPLTGNPVSVGRIQMTEVEGVSHSASGVGGSGAAGVGWGANGHAAGTDRAGVDQFRLGYGAVFGGHERKAIAMAILDLSLSIPGNTGPAADEEFVLQHCDPLEASGFVEHLKLPHYVTFQAQLNRLRYGRVGSLANDAGPSASGEAT